MDENSTFLADTHVYPHVARIFVSENHLYSNIPDYSRGDSRAAFVSRDRLRESSQTREKIRVARAVYSSMSINLTARSRQESVIVTGIVLFRVAVSRSSRTLPS